jgi:hypothetical protein
MNHQQTQYYFKIYRNLYSNNGRGDMYITIQSDRKMNQIQALEFSNELEKIFSIQNDYRVEVVIHHEQYITL